jgi:hypothetical protein
LPPENPRRQFRDLIRSVGARSTANKKFDTSGKSRAYRHHRKNFLSPRREIRPRAFSMGFPESDGGRNARRHILSTHRRLSVASALSSDPY